MFYLVDPNIMKQLLSLKLVLQVIVSPILLQSLKYKIFHRYFAASSPQTRSIKIRELSNLKGQFEKVKIQWGANRLNP